MSKFRLQGLGERLGLSLSNPLQSGHRLLRISFSTLRAGVFLLLSTLGLQATPELSLNIGACPIGGSQGHV